GAELIPVNADTIVVKRTKEAGDVVLPLSEEYLAATQRLRQMAPNPDLTWINSIAFTRYMGPAPGGTRLKNIPDIDGSGRGILSALPEGNQDGYEKTLQSMGLTHWALLQAHRGFMGPDSQSVFLTWTGGSQDYWSMMGVYGDAALGDAKVSGETAATRMHLESMMAGGALGSHLVADFPAAFTAALSKIPGAKPMAVIQRSVLEEHGVFRNTPQLAAGFVKALVNHNLNRRNPRTNIVLDAHEYAYRGEIMSRLREFHRRVAQYRSNHPDWDGKTPLAPQVTRELFGGLVKDDVLNQFLKE